MSYRVFIPVRSASVRLPRKLYAAIGGISVIERTWRQAKGCGAACVTVVAKDVALKDFCAAFGAETFLTDGTDECGTEGVAQAVRARPSDEVVVSVQGDDCLIPPEAIDQCAALLTANNWRRMGTLITALRPEDVGKNSICKVVLNKRGEMLYCSRADIPATRGDDPEPPERYAHMGIYAYRVGFLKGYHLLEESPLEQIEQLEQLRPLYNDVQIHCGVWEGVYEKGVDTKEDLARVRDFCDQRSLMIMG